MIRRPDTLDQFERNMIAGDPADLQCGILIADAMYEQSRALGVWPPDDPLEGIDVVTRVAKVMRHVSRAA